MASISLCMIVKNEEATLARCLRSAREIADEIIIVDTGSTDKTRGIALEFTDKVFDFAWVDDFARARNESFARASMQYCLWLDADDVLLEQDRLAFLSLKGNLSEDVDVVMMRYATGFDAQGNVTFSFYRERLIKNVPQARWQGRVHEVIEPFGNLLYSDVTITHDKIARPEVGRNLRIYERMIEEGAQLDAREQFYFGRELYYAGRYAQAAAAFRAFLEREDGWAENKIEACRFLAYCLYALGQELDALDALLHAFSFGRPRAEGCCDIGKHFFDRCEYDKAIFWYESALACRREEKSGGFVQEDCYGLIPCLQLCVCYYRLGDLDAARLYHQRACQIRPDDPICLQNRAFFDTL